MIQDTYHYIGDILVATSSWEEHVQPVVIICERLTHRSMRGFKVHNDTTGNAKFCRFSFLRDFYSHFVPNDAEIAATLLDLTKSGARNEVEWGPRKDDLFIGFKSRLGQPPILL